MSRMSINERAGRWAIVVLLMIPKHVRAAVFQALKEIGEV